MRRVIAIRVAALMLPLLLDSSCSSGGKKQVAVIPKATSHVFWLTVQAGAVAAGREFGLGARGSPACICTSDSGDESLGQGRRDA